MSAALFSCAAADTRHDPHNQVLVVTIQKRHSSFRGASAERKRGAPLVGVGNMVPRVAVRSHKSAAAADGDIPNAAAHHVDNTQAAADLTIAGYIPVSYGAAVPLISHRPAENGYRTVDRDVAFSHWVRDSERC